MMMVMVMMSKFFSSINWLSWNAKLFNGISYVENLDTAFYLNWTCKMEIMVQIHLSPSVKYDLQRHFGNSFLVIPTQNLKKILQNGCEGDTRYKRTGVVCKQSVHLCRCLFFNS